VHNTLSGTIAASQLVIVQGNGCGSASLTMSGTTITNNGTLDLDSTDGNYALISGSGTLVNNGTLILLEDNGGLRYIRINTMNAGTISIGDYNTLVDSGNTITNDGSFNVAAGAAINFSSSSLDQAGGTLTVTAGGSLYLQSSTLTQSGGTVAGTVVLNGSTLADSAGSGGTFLLECGNTLSGTIPASQTVNIQGNSCGNATTTLSGTTVTNDGTLELDPPTGITPC
jgi:hypothetical protein